jgi:nucleoside-diphosphate-sugar epimerase
LSKVLVTGGAGAIGSRLVHHLCGEHEVLVLDDLSSGWLENIAGLPIRVWRGSVTDEEILDEVFAEQPDVIFHLAANFANQNSVDYPLKDLRVNGIGTLRLLQFALRKPVKRFVYTSSSCVYGNTGPVAREDSSNYSLDTPYAITKLLGEQYVNFFQQHHELPTVVLRIFNNFGPGEYPGKYRNVIPNFMRRVLKGEPLVITGTGDETRDFTFVDDTVRALRLAMDRPEAVGMTFNVGTGCETSVKRLAQLIVATCGRKVAIEYQPRRGWDSVDRRSADVGLIRERLGFQASVDLETGLAKLHQWFLENRIAELEPR